MHLLNVIDGVKQIGLARAGAAAAHIHTGDRTFAAQNDSATCEGFFVLGVSHLDAAHSREGTIHNQVLNALAGAKPPQERCFTSNSLPTG